MRTRLRYTGHAVLLLLCVAALACSSKSQSSCTSAVDCATGQVCSAGVCTSGTTGCQTNGDCASHEFCDAQRCVQRQCLENFQCPTGVCSDGLCQPGVVPDGTSGLDGTGGEDGLGGGDTTVADTTPSDTTVADATPSDTTSGDTLTPDTSGGDTTQSCSQHSQCKANEVCDPLTKVCRPGCRTHGDCDVDQICNETTLTCSGSGSACTKDSDCAGNEFSVCLPVKPDGKTTLEYRCQPPVGGGKAGESCSADGDCASGICLDGGNGKVCFGVCESDDDCNNGTKCYPGMVEYTFDNGTATVTDDSYDSAPACVPPMGSYVLCEGHTDCQQAGETCLPIANATRTGFEFRCFTATGKKFGPGVDCSANSDCASNQCIPPGSGMEPTPENPGICFGICKDTFNDCFGQTECLAVSLTVNDRGTSDTADDIKASATICKFPSQ